jgi:hypothetical protein
MSSEAITAMETATRIAEKILDGTGKTRAKAVRAALEEEMERKIGMEEWLSLRTIYMIGYAVCAGDAIDVIQKWAKRQEQYAVGRIVGIRQEAAAANVNPTGD